MTERIVAVLPEDYEETAKVIADSCRDVGYENVQIQNAAIDGNGSPIPGCTITGRLPDSPTNEEASTSEN